MNTIFYISDGKVTEQEPVSYWNIIRQQAQDALDELGGLDYDREGVSVYLDEAWRPNLIGDNIDTHEQEYIQISDEMWSDYKNALMGEVEKLVDKIKEIKNKNDTIIELENKLAKTIVTKRFKDEDTWTKLSMDRAINELENIGGYYARNTIVDLIEEAKAKTSFTLQSNFAWYNFKID